MHAAYWRAAGRTIDHGAAADLFPLGSLDASVVRNRDAALLLEELPPDDVIAVAPTGFASSYFLARHALTLVEISSLPADVLAGLRSAVAANLDDYGYVRVGAENRAGGNRSLREFEA